MTKYTTPTLEKLLGGNYKWWYILQFSFKAGTLYRGSTLIYMIGRIAVLSLTIFIWWLNIDSGSRLIDFPTVFTYYVIGSMFSWNNGLNWNIAQSIKNGSLSSRLLLPQSVFKVAFLKDFGWWLYSNLFETGLLALMAILGKQYIILSSPANIMVYLLLFCISYLFLSLFGIIIGSIAFFMTEVNGVVGLQDDIRFFLSGKAIPLNLSPFLTPLTFLPFALTFHHPMQIYLGKYTQLQTLYVFLGGLAWCLVLYVLAKLVFKLGLKRYESVGL